MKTHTHDVYTLPVLFVYDPDVLEPGTTGICTRQSRRHEKASITLRAPFPFPVLLTYSTPPPSPLPSPPPTTFASPKKRQTPRPCWSSSGGGEGSGAVLTLPGPKLSDPEMAAALMGVMVVVGGGEGGRFCFITRRGT